MRINVGHGFVWLFCSIAFTMAFNSASAEVVISPGLRTVLEIKEIKVDVVELILGPQGALLSQNQIPDLPIDSLPDDSGATNQNTNSEVGDQGPQGISGEVGATGETGDVGATGPQGEPGIPGPVGPKGDTGLTGATGLVGPQGAIGSPGLTGAIGPKGDIGLVGPTGPQGATGSIGPRGLTGLTGPQGATGPQGPTGPTGPVGSIGPEGPAGSIAGYSELVICFKDEKLVSFAPCANNETAITFLRKN